MRRNDLPLDSPCHADFAAMPTVDLADPTQRGRLCAACDTVVHDLSSMTEASAKRLLARTEGRLCVRYLYDAHGEIVFGDRWPEAAPVVPTANLTARTKSRLVGAALLAAPLLLEACGGIGPRESRAPMPMAPSDAGAAEVDAQPDAGVDAEAGAESQARPR